jgi:putative intracellular protease/amidase
MKRGSLLLLQLCLLIGCFSVVSAQSRQEKPKLKVAILVFEGVQIIDYTGPYEVFGQTGADVYMVAEKTEPLTTAMGMTIVPKYTFENSPKPDVMVIPGGAVGKHWENPKLIDWIQRNAKDSKYVLSVCNGAFFLAKAGLLDGLAATTTAGFIDDLKVDFPKTKVITNQRFVDNGKIITAGGLSAGIEGALQVVSKVYGEGTAQSIALGIEYHWDRNSTFLPATLARKFVKPVRRFLLPFDAVTYSSTGKDDRWEEVVTIKTDLTAADLLQQLNNHLVTVGKWMKKESSSEHTPSTSLWRFTDQDGKAWNGTVHIASDGAEKNKLIVTVKIQRKA